MISRDKYGLNFLTFEENPQKNFNQQTNPTGNHKKIWLEAMTLQFCGPIILCSFPPEKGHLPHVDRLFCPFDGCIEEVSLYMFIHVWSYL